MKRQVNPQVVLKPEDLVALLKLRLSGEVANPNLPLLESVVAALGPSRQRFAFVGGCITGLLVTDAASPRAASEHLPDTMWGHE